MSSIAHRLQRLVERRAERAAKSGHRPQLDRVPASARAAHLVIIAASARAGPSTARSRRAARVVELLDIGTMNYVCAFGCEPPGLRLPPLPQAPTTATPFDINAELESRAKRQEHAQFDQLQAQRH